MGELLELFRSEDSAAAKHTPDVTCVRDPTPVTKISTFPACCTPATTCPPVTFVYVEFTSHDGKNEKLPLKEPDGCKPGSTWYSMIARMAALSLFANALPMGELGILVKAVSLGARIVMSCWNERFAYMSPKLSIRAANWVRLLLPLSSCVRSCVACSASTVRARERRGTSVVRILTITTIVGALNAQASSLNAQKKAR